MHPDVAKLVEAGRINEAVGERLTQISPGNFCLHKNWGAGKILSWDLAGGKIVIDFEKSRNQEMGLKFAIQKTEVLSPDHFSAQKLQAMDELERLATEDPVELVKRTLTSHGGSMKLDALERELSGSVIAAEKYKKWWEGAKRELRATRVAVVPTKRTDPLVLRDQDLSPTESLVLDFENARDFRSKSKALEAILKDVGHFEGKQDQLEKLVAEIETDCRKAMKLNLGHALDFLVSRDEIIANVEGMELAPSATRLSDIVTKESKRLGSELSGLSASRQRFIFEVFPEAFGDSWVEELLDIFDEVGPRGLAEIAKLFCEKKESEKLLEFLNHRIAGRTLGADSLLWVCRERKKLAAPVFSSEVGIAILNLLERDAMDDGPRKSSRLQSYFMEDKELIADMLRDADPGDARSFGRRLMQGQVFPELDRKSLMARVIKIAPNTQDLVEGEAEDKEETYVSSWQSIERLKEELKVLSLEKIPQNREDIKIAKSYGDLRENFEYHAAKDQQKVLMRQKADLEKKISRTQGTDFKEADTAVASMGTVVTLEGASGETKVTLLGAWDSDAEKAILSYLSEFGQTLTGAAIGDTVTYLGEEVTVKAIESYPSTVS